MIARNNREVIPRNPLSKKEVVIEQVLLSNRKGRTSKGSPPRHGVLLSDAGIAFTWGDNRYGQLGRPPVLKEENGRRGRKKKEGRTKKENHINRKKTKKK